MKSVVKKWWFWLIVIVVIGGVGGVVAGSGKTSAPSVGYSEADISGDESSVASHDAEAETDKMYGIGETAIAKSYKLTANSVNVIKSDNQFVQPDEGKEFVEVEFLLENISDSELAVSSVLNCNAYEDGFVVSEDLSAGVASGKDSLNGTVAKGKKLKGSLFYELNEGWKELEIDIDIGLSKDDEVKFLLTK